tara:strand:+ start:694 stop:888 length:195 start_codon:yes stop_codon:yes gene_type:complete
MEIFKYDDNATFEANFYRWYSMNCKEKSQFNEPHYSGKEGRRVFVRLWGDKLHKGTGIKQMVLF